MYLPSMKVIVCLCLSLHNPREESVNCFILNACRTYMTLWELGKVLYLQVELHCTLNNRVNVTCHCLWTLSIGKTCKITPTYTIFSFSACFQCCLMVTAHQREQHWSESLCSDKNDKESDKLSKTTGASRVFEV